MEEFLASMQTCTTTIVKATVVLHTASGVWLFKVYGIYFNMVNLLLVVQKTEQSKPAE